MIGDIVGEVRISARIGSNRSCWFWVSEWAVASEVDGEVGVLSGGSSRGDGGSSSRASSSVVAEVFMLYLCASGTASPTANIPFLFSSSACHLFWYRQISLLPRMLGLVVQAVAPSIWLPAFVDSTVCFQADNSVVGSRDEEVMRQIVRISARSCPRFAPAGSAKRSFSSNVTSRGHRPRLACPRQPLLWLNAPRVAEESVG